MAPKATHATSTRTIAGVVWTALSVSALLLACGARSNIDFVQATDDSGHDAHGLNDAAPGADADTSTDAPTDAPIDASPDSTVVITPLECTRDTDCTDAFECTRDTCDLTQNRCVRELRNSLCDDGVFCNGDEVCTAAKGCTNLPRICTPPVACAPSTCNEAQRQCVPQPNDKLCPISHTCDLQLGCQARAFAHDDATLYDVRLPSGIVTAIGPTGISLFDIALSSTNILYGINPSGIFTVDQQKGTASFLQNAAGTDGNAADWGPDNMLYVAGGNELLAVDFRLGAAHRVATFPPGRASSGDIAFLGNRALATASANNTDELVEFDLVRGTSSVVGNLGFRCVYGLAAFGQTLYGLTCEGRVLSIDPVSGRATQINRTNVVFYGASAR